MAVVSVEIAGLNRLVRDLQAIGVDVDDLKDAFQAVATEAADVIRSGVPVRSGRLAASIRPNRSKNKAVVAAGRGAVPYAAPINYGWPRRNIAGAFFMQRADAFTDRWVEMITQGIEEAIERRGLS